MRLDRNGAVDYARNHWNTVCDDGVFWFSSHSVNVNEMRRTLNAPASDGWNFRFLFFGVGNVTEKAVFQKAGVPDKEVGKDPGLADCAHFLSRCLKVGGKADIKGSTSVPSLVNELIGRQDTRVLAEKVTKEQGEFIVKSGVFKPGDMIGYFNTDAAHGDYGEVRYTHSTMFIGVVAGDVTGAGRITCHTISRFGGLTTSAATAAGVSDLWHLNKSAYRYTFIHFSDDDVPISPTESALLNGWWMVSGASPVFQKIEGRKAYFTFTKPSSSKQSLPPHETANLFNEGNKLSFIWRKTGTVDVWTPNITGGFTVVTNNGLRRFATRLF